MKYSTIRKYILFFRFERLFTKLFFDFFQYIRYIFGQRGKYIKKCGVYIWVSEKELTSMLRLRDTIEFTETILRNIISFQIIANHINQESYLRGKRDGQKGI